MGHVLLDEARLVGENMRANTERVHTTVEDEKDLGFTDLGVRLISRIRMKKEEPLRAQLAWLLFNENVDYCL